MISLSGGARRARVTAPCVGRVVVAVMTVVLAAVTLAIGPAAAQERPHLSPNVNAPVFDADAPDPDVILVGTTYYAYTTGSALGNIPVLRSTDLQTWYPVGDALPAVPSWSVT